MSAYTLKVTFIGSETQEKNISVNSSSTVFQLRQILAREFSMDLRRVEFNNYDGGSIFGNMIDSDQDQTPLDQITWIRNGSHLRLFAKTFEFAHDPTTVPVAQEKTLELFVTDSDKTSAKSLEVSENCTVKELKDKIVSIMQLPGELGFVNNFDNKDQSLMNDDDQLSDVDWLENGSYLRVVMRTLCFPAFAKR
jgi:hypothetical protein